MATAASLSIESEAAILEGVRKAFRLPYLSKTEVFSLDFAFFGVNIIVRDWGIKLRPAAL